MSRRPYPGWPPSYENGLRVGGLHRVCLVVDLLSERPLTDVELARCVERTEAACAADPVTRVAVVHPDRFDGALRQALRQ